MYTVGTRYVPHRLYLSVNMAYYIDIRTLEAVHSALGIPLGRGIGAEMVRGGRGVEGGGGEEESEGEESVGARGSGRGILRDRVLNTRNYDSVYIYLHLYP